MRDSLSGSKDHRPVHIRVRAGGLLDAPWGTLDLLRQPRSLIPLPGVLAILAWPKQAPHRWAKLMPQCSVRERDLFGFPRPGDAYWNEQTLEDVAARYPGMDLGPYCPTGS